MSTNTGIFLLGRSTAGIILAVILPIVGGFIFWWWTVEISVMGSLTGRGLTALEVASVSAGAGFVFASVTRMASWDRNSGGTGVRLGATTTAIAALVLAGAVPLLLHATLRAIPPSVVPNGSDYGVKELGFAYVYPVRAAQSLSLVGLTWTALYLIAVALLGRWWGSVCALLLVAGLIALPSSGMHPALAILDPARAITAWDLVLTLLVALAGVILWRRSATGASALLIPD